MKQIFELASGPLSSIPGGVVHLDPEMKGKHYDTLTMGDSESYERTALSILADLMDENPELLTLPEFYHLWLFVKISTTGSSLQISSTCPKYIRMTEKGKTFEKVCGAVLRTSVNLIDSDIIRCPKDYKIPSVSVDLGYGKQEYFIKPPIMLDEINLISWFQEQGYSRRQIHDMKDNKEVAYRYSKHRMVMHFCDASGKFLFTDHETRSKAVEHLLENISLKEMGLISSKVLEVSKFGVKFKATKAICPSCKSEVLIPLPLQAGLAF